MGEGFFLFQGIIKYKRPRELLANFNFRGGDVASWKQSLDHRVISMCETDSWKLLSPELRQHEDKENGGTQMTAHRMISTFLKKIVLERKANAKNSSAES